MVDRARALAASRAEARQVAGQPVSKVTPSCRDFTRYVTMQRQELAVIARLAPATSRAAPSGTAELVEHARACDQAEVAALAVSTNSGDLSMADVAAVAAATTAPLLRDDPIVHPSQLHYTRLHGADAALFPAGELDGALLRELVAIARSLHMASVIEVTTAAEIGAALELPHVAVGVRCATSDGGIDVERTRQLAAQVSRQCSVIALVDVRSAAEHASLCGVCDAVVVGDALRAAGGVSAALQRLGGR